PRRLIWASCPARERPALQMHRQCRLNERSEFVNPARNDASRPSPLDRGKLPRSERAAAARSASQLVRERIEGVDGVELRFQVAQTWPVGIVTIVQILATDFAEAPGEEHLAVFGCAVILRQYLAKYP